MAWLCEEDTQFEVFSNILISRVWGGRDPQNMFLVTRRGLGNTGLAGGLFLGHQSVMSAFVVTLESQLTSRDPQDLPWLDWGHLQQQDIGLQAERGESEPHSRPKWPAIS